MLAPLTPRRASTTVAALLRPRSGCSSCCARRVALPLAALRCGALVNKALRGPGGGCAQHHGWCGFWWCMKARCVARAALQPSYSRKMRRGGSRRISLTTGERLSLAFLDSPSLAADAPRAFRRRCWSAIAAQDRQTERSAGMMGTTAREWDCSEPRMVPVEYVLPTKILIWIKSPNLAIGFYVFRVS